MSESNGEGHRTRRRAVRSAGPPVEGIETGGAQTATATDAQTATATDAQTASAAGVKATTVAGAKTTTAAGAKTAAEVSAATETAGPNNGSSSEATESGTPGASAPARSDSTADAGKAAVALTKTQAEQVSEAPSAEQKPASGQGRGLPRILAMAAAALLVVALVCGATLSALAMRSAHQRDERRAEYVETARQAIVNLTTIRADSAKQDIDRILSLASGEFKTEFDGRVDPFTSIVQQAKVVSSGEIVEAALESDDDRSGRVLVAAKQTLTNAGQAEPQTRYYRFRVTVARGDSGLTVSDVEFVA
ncbi:hypothetical protein IFM12275_26830 [Nocardia sputorum]|uniref:hypothetical protein n=1 Tax=Nocardia sputorum TaxID=2984338 RepID=UPI002492FD29|nr:hypothetical protein [Nocardia sputorum]BDT92707.1 hypothetical protein IFM12275_26830 [Nocardia sputorum]